MGNKRRFNASRRKQQQPPSTSTTFNQPSSSSQPRSSAAVEPVDPLIKRAIQRALTALKKRQHEKALEFIQESVSSQPLSGHLHHVEGMVHQSLADNAGKDSANVKHLEDGVLSSQLAVELLPNSIRCATLLADLVYQLAFFYQDWGRVVEVCKCALKIENPTDHGVGELLGDDSRMEDEKQTIVMWLKDAEQKNVESVMMKTVEVDKDKKDREVDINNIVMATDRRKKQVQAIMKVCRAMKQQMIDNSKKKFDGVDAKIEEYHGLWSSSLSDEEKRGFQKVNIKELEKYLKSLECQSGVDLLWEAIDCGKQMGTLKFWECYGCIEKFSDHGSYKNHFWQKHWADTALKVASDLDIGSKSADMLVKECVWKPVDTAEAIKIMVSHTSDSELSIKNGLDQPESSAAGEVAVKISRSDKNDSSKTFINKLKLAFCGDTQREVILLRIAELFVLLSKSNCLALTHVRWAMEYTKDQFESIIPLSQFRNLGFETLNIICLLAAPQLREVLKFLRDVVKNCGLSEDAEPNSSKDGKRSGDVFNERIDFSNDFSCLLWQELQADPDGTDDFDADEDDGSAIILPLESENEVFSDSYDIVSWLHVGSNCEEALNSWTNLRVFQIAQAVKFLKMCDKELLHVSTLCDRHMKLSNQLKAIQAVGNMIVDKIKEIETSTEEETQHIFDILMKRREEIQKSTDDSTFKSELEVIHDVLEETLVVLNCDQSESEDCSMGDAWKEADDAIKKASRRLKMQLHKDLALLDATVLRIMGALGQYERELANVSVYDYRSILVPMMKSFLQRYLKDLYEEAKEKSRVAEEALLAAMAFEEAEKKINKDTNDVKQKQDTKKKKRKKKKKKNKNPEKAEESEATDDSNKESELHQRGDQEQETDNLGTKNDESLDELKRLTPSDDLERMLDEYLENQRRFEDEASLNVDVSRTRLPNEDADTKNDDFLDELKHPCFSTDNPETKHDDFLDELKHLNLSDEERMLDEYLENLRRYEEEASLDIDV